MNLRQNNPSLIQMKTIHPKFLVSEKGGSFIRNNEPITSNAVNLPLKSSIANKKLSGENKVSMTTKGRWLQMPMFSFTIEERHTCPSYCKFLSNCYGNNMLLAYRYEVSDQVLKLIDEQLKELSKTYRMGFIIRLHILGDFFSVNYTEFWRTRLKKYKNMHMFGYTARLNFDKSDDRHSEMDSTIFYQIKEMNEEFSDRCAMRFSGYEGDPEKVNYMIALSINEPLAKELLESNQAFICPHEQISNKTNKRKTRSCVECGLCWSNAITKAVIWLDP